MLGFKHDPADVARRAELQKGKFVGEKSPVYGRKKTPEEIKKQLESRGKWNMSDEQKEKLRQANLGKKQKPESIAKMLATRSAKKLAKTS